ncbi:hypothetical protein FRB96_008877 [Tulasnella sp. 330]|nr:hypothetical protein FRB96_008877 [Tulasnella sp. 330]KAG8881825.1 hypothetical protein FRB97_009090 [Tulasnella sp. 331]KAG8887827.1 hypothetical protein FRB98_008899 [Tulasnella sp. 332]
MAPATNYTNPNHSHDEDDHENVLKMYGDPDTYALRKLFIHIGLAMTLFFIWLTFRLFEPPVIPPDFTNYVYLHTLNASTLDINASHRRIIMIGDLHGMMHSFDNLMSKLHYNPKHDLLIHMGDIVAKGPHSNELLSRFALSNVTGVRGNNDQKVIEWYGWMSWVQSHPHGVKWLQAMEEQNIPSKQAKKMGLFENAKFPYPEGWDWNGDHYNIARNMSATDYKYLSSLPVVIHLPSLHTFMVHAGLLPADFLHHLHYRRQPLATIPSSLPAHPNTTDIELARNEQELSLLDGVESNQDPYMLMNLRDLHDLRPSRRGPKDHDEDVVPWSEAWNDVIDRCHGFDIESGDRDKQGKKKKKKGGKLLMNWMDLVPTYGQSTPEEDLLKSKPLPCHPITVVYSHASSRGLDLKKWSKGLDTGCVNGNGLTAMILGAGRHRFPKKPKQHKLVGAGSRDNVDDGGEDGGEDDDDDERDIEIPFGEKLHGRLVTVSCPTPP